MFRICALAFLYITGSHGIHRNDLTRHQKFVQYAISEHRRLDISKDCIKETFDDIWNEDAPYFVYALDFEGIGCVESPCDFKNANENNYTLIKQYCDDKDGQFVHYRFQYRHNKTETNPGEEREIRNFPECIGNSCDSTQFASFYQGVLWAYEDSIDLSVITETSSALQNATFHWLIAMVGVFLLVH
jgi:hypothetical protein